MIKSVFQSKANVAAKHFSNNLRERYKVMCANSGVKRAKLEAKYLDSPQCLIETKTTL